MTFKDVLWESGHDESVEVNQRALIDKVLARYSGEFTVFRELLQNSDDAQSEAVEIRFETQKTFGQNAQSAESRESPWPDLKTVPVHSWVFKNNGVIFRDEDWSRLKKIAEGNPDEEKIGAFGVGFYSLFSVTDDPFVTSGDQWMAFYWKDKKDQLFARRGKIPEDNEHSKSWTTFEMPLREPSPMPTAFDFVRFLASSITFMTHLSNISVFLDEKCLAKLHKSVGLPRELGLPKGMDSHSYLGIMAVNGIKSTPLHIQAHVMNWIYTSGSEKTHPAPPNRSPRTSHGFFSSLFSSLSGGATPQRASTPLPEEPLEFVNPVLVNTSSVSLTIFSAEVNVRLDKKLAAELIRSTKKNPPSRLRYELIYTGKDEYNASKQEDCMQPSSTGSIFQGLRADLDGTGSTRLFIGHATAQTTGIGGHMAARFIPTVERESIDFMDRSIAVWNKELLRVGGFLARSAYEYELADIRAFWEKSSPLLGEPAPDIREQMIQRALHALKFFTFHQSTPSPEVSNLLETAFFSCSSRNQFSILSSKGVLNSSDVRLPDPSLSGFMKQLPVVPDLIFSGSPQILTSLQSRNLIQETNFDDVLKELRSRPLSENEMIACMNWWINVCKIKEGDHTRLLPFRTQLLNAAVVAVGNPGTEDEKLLPLSSIETYLNTKTAGGIIPSDGPMPLHLLPLSINRVITPESLGFAFPWSELSLLQWLNHICKLDSEKDYNINTSPKWAERVLNALARAWPALPNQVKVEVAGLLQPKTCIPTSNGMESPNQAYFPNVNMFHDLPIVSMPSGNPIKGAMDRMLQAFGVRKHVELQVIFNRMIKTNQWTIADLTKYLVSVRSTLTPEEMARLKITAAFSRESETENEPKPSRYQARQLYEPLDALRRLKLPIIDWGEKVKWKGNSDEAKLLYDLGLKRYPTLDTLINLCGDASSEICSAAFQYLLDNVSSKYPDYNPDEYATISFIPALRDYQSCLGSPRDVFSGRQWADLGFLILHPSYQHAENKLKVKENPSTHQLISMLETRPPTKETEAARWFTALSGRISDFSTADLKRLSQTKFVPVKTEIDDAGSTMHLLPPSQCYLGRNANDIIHSKLFSFVDFGNPANSFLIACGTRQEPSVEEIVKTLLADPRRFYALCRGTNQYLSELRGIAINFKNISNSTMMMMKNSPMLLGMQRKHRPSLEEGEADDDEWDSVYDLRKPHQIVIVDDTHAYQVFGDSLFTAPQEDILEAFYSELGSRRLSYLVKEEYQSTAEFTNTKDADDIRKLILERLPLFLHEHTHSRTRVSLTWLSATGNLVVKTFGKLTVTKSLNFEELRLSRRQDASAIAKRIGNGPIQVWISGNAKVDMFEVATCLNRLLFDSPKANDALLLMTILSTDLRSLRRRGYNVTKILRQQQVERQLQEHIESRKEDSSHKSNPAVSPLEKNPTQKAVGTSDLIPIPTESSNSRDIPIVPTIESQANAFAQGTFQNFKRKLDTSIFRRQDQKGQMPTEATPKLKTPSPPSLPTVPQSAATPQATITSNIDMAIRSCRQESSSLIRNREQMQHIKEVLDEGYCDISGHAGHLNLSGEMGQVKVYISHELPQAQAETFMQDKQESLARFIHVLTPLSKVYLLPVTSLHIFCDIAGGLIAFNRNSSLFVNLRYFEAWHDTQVQKGLLQSALISWYFTLAHEIAHNLVQPHNSEHEFYFSAICEKHLPALISLLSSM